MNKVIKIENQFRVIRVALSIAIALAIAFLIISFVSNDPLFTMYNFIIGPFTSINRIGNIIEVMTPLLFTAVGVCIMYSANQINMASEGAFFLGGVATAYIAVTYSIPAGLHPVVAILAGGIVGAFICGIPALMYVKFKALPVVSSLMINYVCLYLGLFIINYIIRDPEAGYMASYKFIKTAVLPDLFSRTNVHFGLIIGLAIVFIGYLYLMKSKWGYSIRMIGKNPNFAKYSGINVPAVIIGCQLLGGFIAGIGGAVEQLGMYTRFQYQKLPGHGFDGVMIAILARYNPKYVPLAAFFLAYIRVGADVMARTSDVPVEIVSIIQAVIIIFVASERFLEGWKLKKIVKSTKEAFVEEEDNAVKEA
ncbi:ABC transporter permease [Tissierella creatinini]|nr:ABC transporter permease [Tissierella creatinini]TJX64329.1 ABC transporter permease [Soehngenia saccharolytica]